MTLPPTIAPTNTSPLVKTLDRIFAKHLDEIPLARVFDQWDADNCPEHLLPWLAWAVSLDNWNPDWPLHIRRARIKAAVDVHRSKGTTAAVRDVVHGFGGQLVLNEWFEKADDAVPHTFEVVMTLGGGAPVTADYQQSVLKEVLRVKPVRSSVSLLAGVRATASLGLMAVIRSAAHHQLAMKEAPLSGALGVQGALRPVSYFRFDLNEV